MNLNPQSKGKQEDADLLKALIVVAAYVGTSFAVSWLAVDLLRGTYARPLDFLLANLMLSALFGYRIKDLCIPNWVALGLFFLSAIPMIKILTSGGPTFQVKLLSSSLEDQFVYLVFVSSPVCCGYLLLMAKAARLWRMTGQSIAPLE